MVIMRILILVILVCLCCDSLPLSDDEDGHYMNRFLVELHERSTAEDVARDHGFEIDDELLGFHVLRHKDVTHRSKRRAVDYVNKLKSDSRVLYADQQKELIRVKREILHDKQVELPIKKILDNSVYYRVPSARLERKDGMPAPTMNFNDPAYKDQWYCHNDGQTGGVVDVDLNVVLAWKNGYTGVGVNVVILDDGIQHTHPDLKDNYRPDLSADLNDKKDNDPTPDVSNSDNSHGTRCAGEIAGKANNKDCGVGIAHGCNIGGIRILDGPITDDLEAKALQFKRDIVDVYSASWGPRDDGRTMESPGRATQKAIETGVREGRGGKGNIFVWASGNGGGNDDDCNCDGYVGMPETMSIGSITDHGLIPYFMEKCPSTMAVVPSGGEEHVGDDGFQPKIAVVTTDLDGGCTENFVGTSASAPLAAGCVALTLDANKDLTWRDVQHIVAKGSRIPAVTDDWVVNGAGYHRSHKFGFGVMDCSLMVQLAIGWEKVPDVKICRSSTIEVKKEVPAEGCISEYIDMAHCQEKPETHVEHMEHVLLYVDVDANRRGAVKITLTSPDETISEMVSTRQGDNSKEGMHMRFLSLNNWGENIVGKKKWKIEICDTLNAESLNKVKFIRYWLEVRGTSDHPNTRSTSSFQPSTAAVAEMKELELKRGKRLSLKRNANGFKKSPNNSKRNEENEKEKNEQKYLKDTIHDISSYLQDRGFEETHIIDILNHGMAYSAKEKKSHEGEKFGVSRRMFGEDEIDHDKFIDGVSKAVNDIFVKKEKERKEDLAEKYLENFLQQAEDPSLEDVEKVLRNVRKILQNRK